MTGIWQVTKRQKMGLLRSIAIYYWKPFNKRRLKGFYGQFVGEGSLCFDLGAHLGSRGNAWLALGARVIMVEPQPQCVKYLNRRFGRQKRVILVDKAVGSIRGTAPFHLSEKPPTVSTMADEHWRDIINDDTPYKVFWEQTIEVEAITLDDLIQSFGLPDFCKIDVENFEVETLRGLSQALPCLSLEFYPATIERAISCIDLLERLGQYEYDWSIGESQKMVFARWVSAEQMRRVFRQMNRQDRYGDFYARLRR